MKLKIKKLFFTMFLCFLFVPMFQNANAMANNDDILDYNIIIMGEVNIENEVLARNIGAYIQSVIYKSNENIDINRNRNTERFPFEKCIDILRQRMENPLQLRSYFIEINLDDINNIKKLIYPIHYEYEGKIYNININIYTIPLDIFNAPNELNVIQNIPIHDTAICLKVEDIIFVRRYMNYIREHVRNNLNNLRLIVPVGAWIYCGFRRQVRLLKPLEFNTRIMNIDIDATKEVLGEGVSECSYDSNGITGYIRDIFIKLSDVFNMINRNA